jgi:hypothetical protein
MYASPSILFLYISLFISFANSFLITATLLFDFHASCRGWVVVNFGERPALCVGQI